MSRSTFAVMLLAAVVAGCNDRSLPVDPGNATAQLVASGTTCSKKLADDIRSQITALFPKTKSLRQAASSQFDNIVRFCPSADAQSKALEFAQFTTGKFRNHQLTSKATTVTVAKLLNDILTYVGLGSGIPADALGPKGAVAEVVPSTSEQVVATGDGNAGARFPPGAVSQPVLVTIAPSADQTDPLPTGLAQFPPFYDFAAYPAVTFNNSVTIGICVNYGNVSQTVLDRLQLARATGTTTVELLPRVAAPFLGCAALPGLAAGPAVPADGAGFVARLLAAAAALVRPTMLHAGTLRMAQFEGIGGLGGTVKNFGDNPTGTVDPLCGALTGIAQAHCSALVALYNATDGPNWTNQTDWLQTTDVCTWYGVSCISGWVQELHLGHNNLTGVLPAQLGDLDSLRLLHLFENNLSGAIPASLNGMVELRELIANHNQFSGAIPSELGSLGRLRMLFLNSNQLSGLIPDALGNLSQLQILSLNENQLSGAIPEALGNLSSLQLLRLQLNQLSGQVPLGIAQLGGRLESQDPVSCSFTPGNTLSMGDSPDYRAADLDGDGFICGVPLVPLSFTSVRTGYEFSCGLIAGGTAYCWGSNQSGQLGNGTTTSRLTPGAVRMPAGKTFASIALGGAHACGLTGNGEAYCWGENNSYGQVGDGTTINRLEPVAVQSAGVTFTSIAAGGAHTCGLTASGLAYCWGYNFNGQLGIGNTDNQSSPVKVEAPAGVTFASLSAGDTHTCGLTAAGEAWCWGDNNLGQLGIGNTTDQWTPVAVSSAVAFASLTAGGAHTCGLTPAGGAYCWGWNTSGQVGNGSTYPNQLAPVEVSGQMTFAALAAGGAHTCGLASGAASCWGHNLYGQLGDNGTTNQSTPVAVEMPSGVTLESLDLGIYQSCALTPAGAAYCWGDNWSGKLGDGTTTNRSTPVAVR